MGLIDILEGVCRNIKPTCSISKFLFLVVGFVKYLGNFFTTLAVTWEFEILLFVIYHTLKLAENLKVESPGCKLHTFI